MSETNLASFLDSSDSDISFDSDSSDCSSRVYDSEDEDESILERNKKKISSRRRKISSNTSPQESVKKPGKSSKKIISNSDSVSVFSNYDEQNFEAVPNSTKNSFKRPLPHESNGPQRKKVQKKVVGPAKLKNHEVAETIDSVTNDKSSKRKIPRRKMSSTSTLQKALSNIDFDNLVTPDSVKIPAKSSKKITSNSLTSVDLSISSNYDEQNFEAVPNSTKNSFKRPLPYDNSGPQRKKVQKKAVGFAKLPIQHKEAAESLNISSSSIESRQSSNRSVSFDTDSMMSNSRTYYTLGNSADADVSGLSDKTLIDATLIPSYSEVPKIREIEVRLKKLDATDSWINNNISDPTNRSFSFDTDSMISNSRTYHTLGNSADADLSSLSDKTLIDTTLIPGCNEIPKIRGIEIRLKKLNPKGRKL